MTPDEFKDWIANQKKRNEEIGDTLGDSLRTAKVMQEEKSMEQKTVVIPEVVRTSRTYFNDSIKKNKIICCVWLLGKDGARDKLVGSAKRKVGRTDFVVKGKRYWINYEELKEGKKCYYYDCDVTNAIGTLSFHDRSDRKVIPSQADDMLRDGVVRVLMGKGGIPAMYLLVAFIVVGIALAGLMYFLSQYQTQLKQIEDLKLKVTNLTIENQALKGQVPLEPTAPEVLK
jgi:hypothetical protein